MIHPFLYEAERLGISILLVVDSTELPRINDVSKIPDHFYFHLPSWVRALTLNSSMPSPQSSDIPPPSI